MYSFEEKEKKRKMRKRITWGVVGFLTFILIVSALTNYNSMSYAEEDVDEAWGQVENVYQRRMDLIPNLVNIVKGYAAHEKETLTGVIEARSKATQITIDPSNATPEDLAKWDAAQGDLTQALGKLFMLTENYPDLKADQQFLSLQAEVAGTENRITVERQKFNKATKDYNMELRGAINKFWSGVYGFEKRNYFKAAQGADVAPVITF